MIDNLIGLLPWWGWYLVFALCFNFLLGCIEGDATEPPIHSTEHPLEFLALAVLLPFIMLYTTSEVAGYYAARPVVRFFQRRAKDKRDKERAERLADAAAPRWE